MPKAFRLAFAALLGLAPALPLTSTAAEPSAFKSVAELQDAHDRALIRDLAAYVAKNPKADDADQAYMALFNRAIEHDWFSEHEAVALGYLKDRPEGPVKPLAQVVSTMARAQANDYPAALARFADLMKGLGQPEQEEFAAGFTDSLASRAVAAGEIPAARTIYQTLADRYAGNPALVGKIKTCLARLDRVGKPAPEVASKDVAGAAVRLDAYRGKYLLVDFWATWCEPCVAELPRLQTAYAKYHDKGFEILGVSLDESKAAVTDFAKVRRVPWRQVHNASAGAGGDGADLVQAFGVSEIPATFLIDPKGVVTRLDLRGPALDAALAKIFGEAAAAKPGKTVR